MLGRFSYQRTPPPWRLCSIDGTRPTYVSRHSRVMHRARGHKLEQPRPEQQICLCEKHNQIFKHLTNSKHLCILYLEKWTVKKLLASSDYGVLILILPLQSLRKPFYKSSQSAACKTLEEHKIYIRLKTYSPCFPKLGFCLIYS